MVGIAEDAARRAGAATVDREELLRSAVQRFVILRQVMRRTVQQLRPEPAEHPAGQQSTRDQQAARAEIGPTQFAVLHLLVRHEPLRVSQIAERCHVSTPAISRILNHLETDELIERHIDPANRRVTRVAVTEAGRAVEEEMVRRFEATLADVLSPLTDMELADLITAFGHLERLVATEDANAEVPATDRG